MKTVLVLAALVAAALAGTLPVEYKEEFFPVDAEFVFRQKKVLDLFYHVNQVDKDAEYYKIGEKFDIEANIMNYTNQKAVEEFLFYFRRGMLPWRQVFSIYNEKLRDEAVALYHLFYYAKDFETFYKTACWARVYMNEGLFVYSFTIAVIHRPDTKGIVLPAPYEIYPYYFINADVVSKMHTIKMYDGQIDNEKAKNYGVFQKDNTFFVTANYSGAYVYDNEEFRLSYFTEDIGLNTYYYYFHTLCPFWMDPEDMWGPMKVAHGRSYFIFYKNLLARYYMERLTNGLGEIPEFSWKWPVKTGYSPNMMHHTMTPFVQRNNDYFLNNEENHENMKFIEAYEHQFLQFLEQGRFKAYNMDIDLWNAQSTNFVGNYWQGNYDLYKKYGKETRRQYKQYYDIIARVLLGGYSKKANDKATALPIALEQFSTSLRDPVFFQLYKHVLYYFVQFYKYVEPYTKEQLQFTGVKVNHVAIDKLVTYYDYFDFNATNAVDYSPEELKNLPYSFMVRQPRLNHKSFNVNMEVKSEVATDAIVKFFIAPKYDSFGNEIPLEENWVNFFELDKFSFKLNTGINKIVRSSDEFFFFKKDSVASSELYKWLDGGKVPTSMSLRWAFMPNRLMLPKGTSGGFPFQFFAVVYPYQPLSADRQFAKMYVFDDMPAGYPFDRYVTDYFSFFQNNMFFKDVYIFHEGEEYVNKFASPYFQSYKNYVTKA